MKRKKTKKALSGSVLALVLCFVMLIGTTFAWFTSSDSTAVNTIQAGTLKVALTDTDGKDLTDKALTWQKAADGKGQEILWEPGATYKTQDFKIANQGNLALKFNFSINGVDGSSKLLEAIDFSVVDSNGTAVALDEFVGHLTAKETTDAISAAYYIKGTMKTTAGNEYQNETLDGIGITVYATQDTVEYDSNGKDYDAGAELPDVKATPVAGVEDFKKIKAGDNVVLTSDIALTEQVTLGDNVTIDGNGHTISGCPVTVGDHAVVKNLTMTTPTNGNQNASCLYAGGSITLDGCTFKNSQWDGVQLTPSAGDVIVINNCSFSLDGAVPTNNKARFIHIESADEDTRGDNGTDVKIIVTNNTFGASTNLTDDIIGIYGFPNANITCGGNTFADTNGTIWIGWSNQYADNQSEIYAKMQGASAALGN